MSFTITEPAQGILLIATQGPGSQVQISGGLQVGAGGLIVQGGGASIGGAFNFGTGGIIVATAGASILGGLDIAQGGLIVASGAASFISTLTLTSGGLVVGSGGASLAGITQFGTHLVSASVAAVATPGANLGGAGSQGSASVVGGDIAGVVNFFSGTSQIAGGQVFVAFGSAFALRPYIVVAPMTATLAAAQPFVAASTNSFTLNTAVALNPSASHAFMYQVMG